MPTANMFWSFREELSSSNRNFYNFCEASKMFVGSSRKYGKWSNLEMLKFQFQKTFPLPPPKKFKGVPWFSCLFIIQVWNFSQSIWMTNFMPPPPSYAGTGVSCSDSFCWTWEISLAKRCNFYLIFCLHHSYL